MARTILDYSQAVAALGTMQKRGWRLELDRMRAFLQQAGLEGFLGPHPRYMHVAGTNGKGSTTATLHSILAHQGHRTGATFSPYVYNLRERVQMNGELIPEAAFAEIVSDLLPLAQAFEATEFGGPTEFEFKTAVGFAHWQRERAEWVALEVGLGGRFDATNVVDPACSVIVSIGWDHMHLLGDTLGKIAFEKAGIIKPGRPCVMGELAAEAAEVVERVTRERGAPLWRFGQEIRVEPDRDGVTVHTPARSHRGLRPALHGSIQVHNMALAVAACEAAGAIVDPTRLAKGVAATRLPGRFQRTERHQVPIFLDGAHNVDSAQILSEQLFELEEPEAAELRFISPEEYRDAFRLWHARRARDPRLLLVTGMVRGHEHAPFYSLLAPLVKTAHFVPISGPRGVAPDELAREIGPLMRHSVVYSHLTDALQLILSQAGPEDVVLVTGSFYLVGEAGVLLDLGGLS